jgi:hypothetical protein
MMASHRNRQIVSGLLPCMGGMHDLGEAEQPPRELMTKRWSVDEHTQ